MVDPDPSEATHVVNDDTVKGGQYCVMVESSFTGVHYSYTSGS